MDDLEGMAAPVRIKALPVGRGGGGTTLVVELDVATDHPLAGRVALWRFPSAGRALEAENRIRGAFTGQSLPTVGELERTVGHKPDVLLAEAAVWAT